ncbi:hypothetical protein SRB17_59790 [Streptomyces sp. RB17]|nr:hypothetical protein [Streptomyces sp. RB17]
MLGGKDGWFDDLIESDDEKAVRLNARSLASLGADDLHKAAIAADAAAHSAARDLNKWVSEARRSKLGTGDLTAVDKLMLAETSAGDDYQRHDLDDAADREGVLSDVEKAVADGRPVPVDVQGKDGAHAMTIIGQEGDMLQIYNPWGTTTWVSENDFINGHMSKAADSGLNDAYSVYLPTAK